MSNKYTVYKVDSKGKMRFKTFYASGDKLIQESGILGGKVVVNKRGCKEKNVGRANYTSAEDQAKLQAERKYQDELLVGYFKTQKEAKETVAVLPMLAQDFFKRESKLDLGGGFFLQPKLDGMRCLAKVVVHGEDEDFVSSIDVELISRKNRVIENMEHIEEDIRYLFDDFEEGIYYLDGELYVHGENFQTNMSYVKKYYKGLSERIGYHVYDTILEDSYEERQKYLKALFALNPEALGDHKMSVHLLPTIFTEDSKDFPKHFDKFIDDGYEGMMVRVNDKTPYQINKRSNSLLKYKKFIDATGRLVDVVPQNKRPTHGKPIIEMNGKRFSAGTKLTWEQREDLLKNKHEYIGKTAEIRFFEYSAEGIPRFPIYHGIRLDK